MRMFVQNILEICQESKISTKNGPSYQVLSYQSYTKRQKYIDFREIYSKYVTVPLLVIE